MRQALRGFIVCLFAVALVVNGGASRILADVQTGSAHHFAAKKGKAGHQGQHQTHHHDHAQPDGASVAFNPSPAHDHMGDDAKCCTMCIILDNAMPGFLATASQFRYWAVVFNIGRQHLVGHLVALDPDIPKAIV
jgi:hypothetical protein